MKTLLLVGRFLLDRRQILFAEKNRGGIDKTKRVTIKSGAWTSDKTVHTCSCGATTLCKMTFSIIVNKLRHSAWWQELCYAECRLCWTSLCSESLRWVSWWSCQWRFEETWIFLLKLHRSEKMPHPQLLCIRKTSLKYHQVKSSMKSS